jgi:hypothetical protein
MGAGVDSLIGDATLPRTVPLLRVIDPLMSERMATWVLWGVINCQVGHSRHPLGLLRGVRQPLQLVPPRQGGPTLCAVAGCWRAGTTERLQARSFCAAAILRAAYTHF